jgi:hypothetical protein
MDKAMIMSYKLEIKWSKAVVTLHFPPFCAFLS